MRGVLFEGGEKAGFDGQHASAVAGRAFSEQEQGTALVQKATQESDLSLNIRADAMDEHGAVTFHQPSEEGYACNVAARDKTCARQGHQRRDVDVRDMVRNIEHMRRLQRRAVSA